MFTLPVLSHVRFPRTFLHYIYSYLLKYTNSTIYYILVFIYLLHTSTASFRLDTTGSFSLPCLSSTWTVDQLIAFLHHASISSAMGDPHALPFIIEHDWSDVDPDPPDSDIDPHPLSSTDEDTVL